MKKLQKIVGGLVFIFMISLVGLWALDNLVTESISVGLTPTEILVTNIKVRELLLYNRGTATIYIDNTSSECNTGFPLIGGKTIKFNEYRGAIWGVTKISTTIIEVIYIQY